MRVNYTWLESNEHESNIIVLARTFLSQSYFVCDLGHLTPNLDDTPTSRVSMGVRFCNQLTYYDDRFGNSNLTKAIKVKNYDNVWAILILSNILTSNTEEMFGE